MATEEYMDGYGLVYAKAAYANYVIAAATAGIQFFMNCYCSIVFLETPRERRQGRALYLVAGWLICAFYTMGACFDISRIFQDLLEASNGLEYAQLSGHWIHSLNLISILLVFIVGDGLLLYRCYLLLAGGWLRLFILPIFMYLSTIAFNIVSIVLASRDPEDLTLVTGRVSLGFAVLIFLTNFVITSILCYRLVSAHQDLTRSMPSARKRLAVYQTAMRILIESGLPLTIAGLIYMAIHIVPMIEDTAVYDDHSTAFLTAHEFVTVVYFALQAIAPQLIIFRVTAGRSWAKTNRSSAEALSHSLAFNNGPQAEEYHLSGRITRNDDEMIAEESCTDPDETRNVRFKE
ncbi:hypothetical protein FA15DRAFT_709329 [Coprinopsis marcescibilis]|uniref:Uncharacterized protein n=1 Tax=Coprinopsis marcescibilis TaxID=230819 RepID=A0A5C3KGR8_COPMA|nr:hypothetical protein FA15DRAFT_709329 [Coprinopsis marcescibilis]